MIEILIVIQWRKRNRVRGNVCQEEMYLQADSVESEFGKVGQVGRLGAGTGERRLSGLLRVGAGAFQIEGFSLVRGLARRSASAERVERARPPGFIRLGTLLEIRFVVHRVLTCCVRRVHITWTIWPKLCLFPIPYFDFRSFISVVSSGRWSLLAFWLNRIDQLTGDWMIKSNYIHQQWH